MRPRRPGCERGVEIHIEPRNEREPLFEDLDDVDVMTSLEVDRSGSPERLSKGITASAEILARGRGGSRLLNEPVRTIGGSDKPHRFEPLSETGIDA